MLGRALARSSLSFSRSFRMRGPLRADAPSGPAKKITINIIDEEGVRHPHQASVGTNLWEAIGEWKDPNETLPGFHADMPLSCRGTSGNPIQEYEAGPCCELCHVLIPHDDLAGLEDMDPMEARGLGLMRQSTPNSRLSCRVFLKEADEGLTALLQPYVDPDFAMAMEVEQRTKDMLENEETLPEWDFPDEPRR